jgi:hypothetical protein
MQTMEQNGNILKQAFAEPNFQLRINQILLLISRLVMERKGEEWKLLSEKPQVMRPITDEMMIDPATLVIGVEGVPAYSYFMGLTIADIIPEWVVFKESLTTEQQAAFDALGAHMLYALIGAKVDGIALANGYYNFEDQN